MSLVSGDPPVQKPWAPPKVTPLHTTAVRSQLIYKSFGEEQRMEEEVEASELKQCSYEDLSVLLSLAPCSPREQRCHQGAAAAPPHLIPFEANSYIMRLLVLLSLWPCPIKTPSGQMWRPLVGSPDCLCFYSLFLSFVPIFQCFRTVAFETAHHTVG